MSAARILGGELLPVEGKVRRDVGAGGEEAERAGDGERAAEKDLAADVRFEQCLSRGAAPIVVTVPSKRDLVRVAQLQGLNERRTLRLACMSPSVLESVSGLVDHLKILWWGRSGRVGLTGSISRNRQVIDPHRLIDGRGAHIGANYDLIELHSGMVACAKQDRRRFPNHDVINPQSQHSVCDSDPIGNRVQLKVGLDVVPVVFV